MERPDDKPVAYENEIKIVAKRLILGSLQSEDCYLTIKDYETLVIGFSLEATGEREVPLKTSDISKIEQSYEPANSFLQFSLRPPVAQLISQLMPEGFSFTPLLRTSNERRFILEFHDSTDDSHLSMLKNVLSSVTPKDLFDDEEQPQPEVARPGKREHEILLDADGFPVLEDGEPPRALRSRNRRRENVLQDAAVFENIAHSSQVTEKKKKKKRPNATLPKEFDAFVDTEELFEYASLTKGMESRIVRMEDYKCLHFSELLSDVILDFWLQYTYMEKLTDAMRDRVYIFPAVFYTWYSTPPTFAGWNQAENKDVPAAEKRYDRVSQLIDPQADLFNKDFIIIPCLDREHWFVAVVCYLRLNGVVSFAEGTRLPQEFGARDPVQPTEGEAVKQSCILIFDSVKDKSGRRKKAMTHIKTLMESISNKVTRDFALDKAAVICASVKCPHQSNGTDCGLFLLEFVEHFLMKDPLHDFRVPIDLENWFDPSKVQSKRAEIAEVILKKTSEWRQGTAPPMPALKFFDDAIIIDSDNNNDANVVDKMDEDVVDTLPVRDENSLPVIDPIVNTIENPSVAIPAQDCIIELLSMERQPANPTAFHPEPEEFMLSSQDVYDDPEDKSDSANSSGVVDPLMPNGDEKMQFDDEPIVVSE